MILTKRTKEPTTCFVCQGQAMAVGVAKQDKKGYAQEPFNAWTCFDCVKVAKELINMKPGDVGRIESNAFDTVSKAKLDDGIQTFIGALYDAGVRNLDDATDDQIEMAKERLIVNGDAIGFTRDIVLAFGDEVRAAVERGDAPF